ncbi:MAG: glycosyltransferase family A protein [Pirellulaceae bacterium]|nr:glycosyltransferase family A protein [Pirellulaceae bacterium]
MKLSVVIPFYNAEQYIEQCIEGLLLQSLPTNDFEIIMVDNNSTDLSAKIVGRYPQIHLLQETKQGSYAARNRGISAAKGELVALTDPDCVPRSDWLEQALISMHSADVQITIGSRHIAIPHKNLSLLFDYENQKDAYILNSEMAGCYYGHTNNMVVRRALFDSYGQFDEVNRGADTMYVRSIVDSLSTNSVAYNPEMSVKHLEVDCLSTYFKKVRAYARSRQRNKILQPTQSIGFADRWRIFLQTIRTRDYPLMDRLKLLAMLMRGMLDWSVSDLKERWKIKTETLPVRQNLSASASPKRSQHSRPTSFETMD